MVAPMKLLLRSVWLFALLASLSPVATYAGSDTLKWCRGGALQGRLCDRDRDCPEGLCSSRGMPRVCAGRHYCQVSTSVECTTNYDCRKENGGRWPQDPADFCMFVGQPISTCDPANADDGGATDCGECADGALRGRGCLTAADCSGASCIKKPGLGVCIDGAYQCHIERTGHGGLKIVQPHDAIGDIAVGQLVTGLNLVGGVTARAMYHPTSVAIDRNGDLYVGERRRVTRRAHPERHDIEAVAALGQVSLTRSEWDNVSDDVNVGGIDSRTSRTLIDLTERRPVHPVSNPDLRGVLVGDSDRVVLYPESPATNAAAVRVWGHVDPRGTRSFDLSVGFGDVRDIATQRRCVGGPAIGTPCAADSECTQSRCATTIAFVDTIANRISIQRQPPDRDGAPFDVFLGQRSGETGECNNGGLSATSLCHPGGAVFDHDGNLWISDSENNRVLRFPRHFVTGTPADRVLGQEGDFTTNTPGCDAERIRFPAGLAWDGPNRRLWVGVRGNDRVLQYNDPSNHPAAVVVYGQRALTECGAGGRSTDGIICDGFAGPTDVEYDGQGHIWVADQGNNRALRFPVSTQNGVPADVLQGQDHCGANKENRVTASSFQRGSGGIAFFETGKKAGVCASDVNDHRVLCWNDREAVMAPGQTPPADAVLGQTDGTSYRPNRGAKEPTAATLRFPAFPGATSRGSRPGVYVPDAGNNRVLRYVPPLSSGMAAKDVLGQARFTDTTCSSDAKGLCAPRSVKADRWGNLWVVDSGNGRVGLYCMSKNTIPRAGGGWICTADNQGDAALDMVLGKPSVSATWDRQACTAPDAASLCTPTDIDVSDLPKRLFISDNASPEPRVVPLIVSGRSRALIYEGPFRSGLAAVKVVGTPDGSLRSLGADEPLSGSNSGYCNGGARAGQACSGHDDDKLQGNVSPDCGAGGWCDWSRSQADGSCLAYDPRHDWLYVGRGGGIGVYAGPFPAPKSSPKNGDGHAMIQVFGATGETQFGTTGVGYTVCQQTRTGGCALDKDFNLWVVQGAQEESNASILVTLDPAPAPAASSATRR